MNSTLSNFAFRACLVTACLITVVSCKNNGNKYDASGTFESEETIIPAEIPGIIGALDIEEGQTLAQGQTIGYIDSTQLYLKKKQLQQQIQAVLSKRPDIAAQIAALQEQLKQAEHEQARITRLMASDAATQKQLDDANAQIAIIKKQIDAQRSALGTTTTGITQESQPLWVQIEQLDDQLKHAVLVAPMNGTVLTKYARTHEMATTGKALYKMADLSALFLRAYITAEQFAVVKMNQKVKVFVDDAGGNMKEMEGMITWISNKAEFTPKTIQTKDERANLVYAVKIKVVNDGSLKIGMYGEVKLN